MAPALEDSQLLAFDGLMEYGSIFGHGAYLGPELHRRLPRAAPEPIPIIRQRLLYGKSIENKDRFQMVAG